MVYALDERASIRQALVDAGFSDAQVASCQSLIEAERVSEALKPLYAHRREALAGLRRYGRQIDCLDYLISSLKKKEAQK